LPCSTTSGCADCVGDWPLAGSIEKKAKPKAIAKVIRQRNIFPPEADSGEYAPIDFITSVSPEAVSEWLQLTAQPKALSSQLPVDIQSGVPQHVRRAPCAPAPKEEQNDPRADWSNRDLEADSNDRSAGCSCGN
jgi:hypothetical protein